MVYPLARVAKGDKAKSAITCGVDFIRRGLARSRRAGSSDREKATARIVAKHPHRAPLNAYGLSFQSSAGIMPW
jgi:hypothetical protein